MPDIVLASSSPRRIELMRRMGLDVTVIPPQIDEDADPLIAFDAAGLSRKKAEEVVARCNPASVVIAADTLVVCGGRVLGKPKDEDEAFDMLTRLSGKEHTVVTGVTVARDGKFTTRSQSTCVWMRGLTAPQIRAYIATGEPMDKAGAYGIQERGAMLVERVDGDFYNVMGLPVCLLAKMLEEFGIDILLR